MTSKKDLVQIANSSLGTLSKNQKLFNRLTTRIESLKKRFEEEQGKFTRISQEYYKEIAPIDIQISELRIQLAFAIDTVSGKQKLTKSKKEYLGNAIVYLLDDSAMDIELNEEQIALYNKWSVTSYEEKMQEESEYLRQRTEEMLRSQMGVDMDLSQFEKSPEGRALFQEKLEEELKNAQEKAPKSKLNSKQQAKENLKKAEEELKLKSLRAVYINLAKALHPDTETNAEQKIFKEELMKKVSLAYEQKDFFTLLSLEIEWIHNTQNQLGSMPDEKLTMYINVLKDQERQLKSERDMMLLNPAYEPMHNLLFLTEKQAFSTIKKETKEMKTKKHMFEVQIKEVMRLPFSSTYSFVKEYCHMKTQANLMEFLFEE